MKNSPHLPLVPMLLSILSCSVMAQAKHQSNQVVTARQWEVIDISFRVDRLPERPTEIEFSASLENESSQPLKVLGFYNGGEEYLIRFTPPRSGKWSYVTQSSLADLNDKKGTVSVDSPQKNRQGGIVVDPKSPQQFRYENGDSYYPIAFESDWLFALDAENATEIPVTRKFVDTLASNGFNQIVMNVFAYDVNWKKDDRLVEVYEYGSPRTYPFGGSNSEPDHSRLNIEYFKRLDRVIDYLDRKGIAAHLMIYVWNKKVNWPAADSKEDNAYFEYVVKRYQAYPNMVWDVSKEALGYGHNDVDYISGRIDRLRKLDAYKRLVTVHDYSYCKRFPDKLDFISVQLWGSELYSVMRKVRADFPDKPILNIEHGGYEAGPYVVFQGSYTSSEVCLERAYQCIFAGTYPTHYWQGAAWNVIIPDIEAMEPEQRPHLEYYRHLRTLIQKYDLNRLTAGDKKSSSGFCLHNADKSGKGLHLYYVPKENIGVNLRLPKAMKGQEMTAVWFDPFTGEFSAPITKAIPQWPSFAKPAGNRFAVLIVQVAQNHK